LQLKEDIFQAELNRLPKGNDSVLEVNGLRQAQLERELLARVRPAVALYSRFTAHTGLATVLWT
jgi:hypothetical protein